ncbi:hypothetical protein AD947_03080 [Acetobacter tropicalis]|uniref:Tyr recombinase domain-containing protein n=1 Tax=Acetobacter tropicalis TaxID=104102 RepID=A0A149U3M8_9PROT|nr:site-specific integrase [Acetobacter tropicalis]KXV59957.1 hypothetical protein AD947_03080 [Acetobacter tropicalis]
MSLSYRKRGKCWYARGTVRIGREVITVKEFNTGCSIRADAEAVGAAEEAKIRVSTLDGPKARQCEITLAELFTDYIEAKKPKSYLIRALMDLTKSIGHYRATDAGEAWLEWLQTRGKGLSNDTKVTWRGRYTAAVNFGAELKGIHLPKIMQIRRDTRTSTIYLSKEDQEKLIAAYAAHARPIAITLCFQGLRSGEAIRLDWRYVNFERRSLFIHKSKNGKQRSIPMHARVHEALHNLWEKRGKPTEGIVFLNRFGRPFVDRSDIGEGGNPLACVHKSACRVAGIKGFTPHGWRHHWASWMVMSGCDLFTLTRLGGWSSIKMVQRYAAVSADHMRDAIDKLT